MKNCCKCKLTKDIIEFNKNNSKPDGLQTICRTCSNNRSAEHYVSNKQSYQKSKKKSIQILQEYVLNYLREHPCIDCSESDPVCLDFDHVTGIKYKNISVMVHNGVSLDNLKLEIEKCVVRCANCHRKKTAKDFNWFKIKCNIIVTKLDI
jgi:hypothetical protein